MICYENENTIFILFFIYCVNICGCGQDIKIQGNESVHIDSKDIVAIGKPAMKPLYWIIYKSGKNEIYEYMCACALQEISGISFEDEVNGTQVWSTAKNI